MKRINENESEIRMNDEVAPGRLVAEKPCEDALLDILRKIYDEASYGKVSAEKVGAIQRLSAQALAEGRSVRAKIIRLRQGENK